MSNKTNFKDDSIFNLPLDYFSGDETTVHQNGNLLNVFHVFSNEYQPPSYDPQDVIEFTSRLIFDIDYSNYIVKQISIKDATQLDKPIKFKKIEKDLTYQNNFKFFFSYECPHCKSTSNVELEAFNDLSKLKNVKSFPQTHSPFKYVTNDDKYTGTLLLENDECIHCNSINNITIDVVIDLIDIDRPTYDSKKYDEYED